MQFLPDANAVHIANVLGSLGISWGLQGSGCQVHTSYSQGGKRINCQATRSPSHTWLKTSLVITVSRRLGTRTCCTTFHTRPILDTRQSWNAPVSDISDSIFKFWFQPLISKQLGWQLFRGSEGKNLQRCLSGHIDTSKRTQYGYR